MSNCTKFFVSGEEVLTLFHTPDACSCAGEGECQWCKTHCSDCGGTSQQHPVTEEYLTKTFGKDFRDQGFEPHNFQPIGEPEKSSKCSNCGGILQERNEILDEDGLCRSCHITSVIDEYASNSVEDYFLE